MCDYSLELYRSRPARAGEVYVSRRFPSGTIGLTAPDDPDTAVCLAADSRLALSKLPVFLRQHIQSAEAAATFVRRDEGPHHDALRFDTGVEVTLQQMGPDVEVTLIDALVRPIPLRQYAMAELV